MEEFWRSNQYGRILEICLKGNNEVCADMIFRLLGGDSLEVLLDKVVFRIESHVFCLLLLATCIVQASIDLERRTPYQPGPSIGRI